MKKMTPETAIKKTIKQFLQYNRWYIFPILQGLGAHKGVSDFIAIKDGRTIFLEVKTPKGKQSEYQKEFERQVVEHGGEYYIVHGIDDIKEIISNNVKIEGG